MRWPYQAVRPESIRLLTKQQPETVAFYENHVFPAVFADGPDGNRTRVQKPIPCPSTSVVCDLTFPLPVLHRHSTGFGSFIVRLYGQSLPYIVSHKVEA